MVTPVTVPLTSDAVAVAPEPPPPERVMTGLVYPLPGLVMVMLITEKLVETVAIGNSSEPTSLVGSENQMSGALYPVPPLVMVTAVTTPEEFTVATAVAPVPVPPLLSVIVTTGGVGTLLGKPVK